MTDQERLLAASRQNPKWVGVVYDGSGLVSRGMNFTGEQNVALLAAFKAAVEAEREACAKVAEQLMRDFGDLEYSTDQPMGSFNERFACGQVAKAIRERS